MQIYGDKLICACFTSERIDESERIHGGISCCLFFEEDYVFPYSVFHFLTLSGVDLVDCFVVPADGACTYRVLWTRMVYLKHVI